MNVKDASKTFKEVSILAKGASSWLTSCAKDIGIQKDEPELVATCLRLANQAEVGSDVLKHRTTIGVFGASQAGKSYLVNTLASGGAELSCQWGEERIEFMAHVNPAGGDKEATGAVTRFTHDVVNTPKNFPVCIRILRNCEVAMILCNSFFNDFVISNETLRRLDERFDEQSLEQFFTSLEQDLSLYCAEKECSLGISPADVVLMADYIKEHGKGVLGTLDAASPFWVRVRKLAPKLNPHGLSKLFSILWGGMEVLTALFLKIATELFKLRGSSTIYTGIDAFVQKTSDGKLMQYQQGTLLSIITLTKLFADPRNIHVAFYEGNELREVEVGFASLAAALLELQFPLQSDSKLGNFDVLDFPGARARRSDSCEDFLSKGLTTETLDAASEFLRRGKVAYLFDRYSQDREVDVLLFCINSASQQEVSSLVTILNGWIAMNVGATPQEREKSGDIPLLGVLTRFDQALEKDFDIMAKGQHSMGRNVMSAALEHFRNCAWLNEWTPNTEHKRFFLVRRPGLCALFDRQGERELAFKPEFLEKLMEFRQAFVADPDVSHLYQNADKALDEVMKLDDGGAGAILDLITKEFSDYSKSRERICEDLTKLTKKIYTLLEVYQSGSGSKAAARAKERGLKLSADFRQCDELIALFSKIRAYIEPDEIELERMYLDAFSHGRNAARFAHESVVLVEDKLRSLSQGEIFNSLKQELVKVWGRERANFIALEKDAVTCSFFKAEDGISYLTAEDPLIAKRLRALLDDYATEAIKSIEGLELEKSLATSLDVNELLVDNPAVLAALQSRVVRQKICAFLLYWGFDLGKRDFELKRSSLDSHYADDYKPFKFQSGLTKEQAEGYQPISTLPNLTEDYRLNCGKILLLDHLTALVNLMISDNLNVQSRYKLNAMQSDELEKVMTGLDLALERMI